MVLNYGEFMRIASTQYSASTRSLDIYFSGCAQPHCAGCHNKELFDFKCGVGVDESYIKSILSKITDFDVLINNIFLLGGEPLDQDVNKLEWFIKGISRSEKNIWLFTKYNFEDMPKFIFEYCNYIKSGRYDKKLTVDDYLVYGVKLSTANQIIYKKGVDY